MSDKSKLKPEANSNVKPELRTVLDMWYSVCLYVAPSDSGITSMHRTAPRRMETDNSTLTVCMPKERSRKVGLVLVWNRVAAETIRQK